jgi:hypothetical protein
MGAVNCVEKNAVSQTWTEASNRLRLNVTAVQQTRAEGVDTCRTRLQMSWKPRVVTQWSSRFNALAMKQYQTCFVICLFFKQKDSFIQE